MLGIVLCGGQSSRMGSDKGLLKLEAKTWAQTAVDKFSMLGIPVMLSVNSRQYHDYAAVFAQSSLIKDDSSLPLQGPLLGTLSCHLKYPSEDLFVLACDMPLMEPSLLKELYKIYQQTSASEAFIFTNDGEPEPLCAIYRAPGLDRISTMLRSGELTRFSMKFMLEHLLVYKTPLTENQQPYFRNFNAHAELNGL
ncbi:MAG TPA: molybdenum cofactor guanylyltransferase [Chitinophagaceae bacterium]|nr:molybdenum cofactor guanylyltransferase [Chitinophagaceae bacterium]